MRNYKQCPGILFCRGCCVNRQKPAGRYTTYTLSGHVSLSVSTYISSVEIQVNRYDLIKMFRKTLMRSHLFNTIRSARWFSVCEWREHMCAKHFLGENHFENFSTNVCLFILTVKYTVYTIWYAYQSMCGRSVRRTDSKNVLVNVENWFNKFQAIHEKWPNDLIPSSLLIDLLWILQFHSK